MRAGETVATRRSGSWNHDRIRNGWHSVRAQAPAVGKSALASDQPFRLAPTKRTDEDSSRIPIAATSALSRPQSSTFSTGRIVRVLQGSRRVPAPVLHSRQLPRVPAD